MASEERPRESLGRRLTKKRKESRRGSLDIPERFRPGDDVHDDVTAPKRKDAVSMNQSLFSMITRAGQQSQAELRALREAESGDSEDERPKRAPSAGAVDGTSARLRRIGALRDGEQVQRLSGSHLQSPAEHRLLRSSKKKTPTCMADAPSPDQVSSSQILRPPPSPAGVPTPPSDRPTIRTETREHTPTASSHGAERPRPSDASPERSLSNASASASLAQRLQQIFEFESVEEVIADYNCWLLQSILVQGDLYITQKHICFYAYLPKKHHDGKKTGYLAKRGRTKYNRYWFELQGDVLAYFTDATEKYYPRHRINLRYAISAEVVEPKDKAKEETVFLLRTDERKYQFKADSAVSAKEWVRAIQKVIFRTHNEGNSVKISLPIANVLEVEQSPVLDFNHTFKIRVIDNDRTFAIDEYFFSFHSHGEDALNVLQIMISDNDLHQLDDSQIGEGSKRPSTASDRVQAASSAQGRTTPAQITDRVRATLSPLPGTPVARTSLGADSARSSTDVHRRASYERRPSGDFTRTSTSRHSRHSSRHSSDEGRKSESFEKSGYTQTTQSSPTSPEIQSMDESTVSASQILGGSDVFRPPEPYLRPETVTGSRQSHDQSRLSPMPDSDTAGPSSSQLPHQNQPRNQRPQSGTFATGNDPYNQQTHTALTTSTSTLHSIASYPLQKATGLAGFFRTRSKRVGGLLASESKGYYAKVSGMLAGGRKHYAMGDGSEIDEHPHRYEENEDATKAAEHFREHFGFSESEELQSSYFASLQRVLPNYGKIYISKNHLCFRSLMPTSKLKVILPIRDIETVNKENGFRLGYHGLAVVIRGHEELFFEFSKAGFRDECAISILRPLEAARITETADSSSEDDDSEDETAKAEHRLLKEARREKGGEETTDIIDIIRADHDRIPLIFDDPHASIVDFKPTESLTFVCLTIGSRGDVQPYIALCKELMKEGHKTRIATHDEFEPWVRKHGIDFARVEGNPAELMRICVEHGMFTFSFLREANSKFRGWLDNVCNTAWKACQGADVLIESPSAMVGIHIAEALGIPYFRAFTMPWTRTRAYPHAFSVLEKKMGGSYNAITYTAFDTLFWTAIAGQINNWRRRDLGLASTSQSKMQANARPFMYNFSPSVVPPPLDWPDWIRVTGYWFLDESDNYEPPEDLLAFIAKAREDGKKLVYVGFGSVVIEDPAALTRSVVESVQKAEVRCVLSKGWSDRLENKDASKVEVELPEDIFQIQSAPHDWLFKQMDAVVHHGGSGTTGASLRAGKPTIIHPFFGDQFFYASRVEDLGVGIWLKIINTSLFSLALWRVCNDNRIIIKAKTMGQKIRKENGTQVAIQTLYRELDRARAQIQKHTKPDDDTDEFDEDWTMIEEEENFEFPRVFELQEPPMNTEQAQMELADTEEASKEGVSKQG